MPIILANSHSHEFSYTDGGGVTHTVKLTRGQVIPEGVPVETITELVAETVVSFNGETLLPRYQRVAAVEGGPDYSAGVVTKERQARDLSHQLDSKAPQFTAEELAEKLAKAEAEAEAEAQRRVDADAQVEAAAQQLAREEAEDAARVGAVPDGGVVVPSGEDVRAELIAELKSLGKNPHPATGEAKLRAALDAAREEGIG